MNTFEQVETRESAATPEPLASETTRARYPDRQGYVERAGNRLFYEVYGDGEPTVFLLPTWTLVHSRFWKAQVAYLARHFRVLTFDGLGNGHSDRPKDRRAYGYEQFALDALAVMDATDTDQAVLAALSRGAQWQLELAANHGDRVLGASFIGPFAPITRRTRLLYSGQPLLYTRIGKVLRYLSPVGKFHPDYISAHYPEFVDWWMHRCAPEPHSTRQIESAIEFGLDTDAETVNTTLLGRIMMGEPILELCERVSCPTQVISGKLDVITPHRDSVQLARALDAELVTLPHAAHGPHGRWPVETNLALRRFVERCAERPTVSRDGAVSGASAPRKDRVPGRDDGRKRALLVSSPIGLGHARRDVAIAQELRKLVPDLEIDWLAQDPVTRVLEEEGERIHPASGHLANESHHLECESAEHDLQVFQSFRRMDEILIANFMVFHDVVQDKRYDLWIGDEAWELDHFLHENPNEKRAHFCWLTDFVGWLPMPDGGDRERYLTTDYNAEMVEHIDDHPGMRDRSIFVGNPDDIVPDGLGKDLPLIRDWTERHFDFAGYVTGFDPARFSDREKLRAELGYRADEQVVLVTVGGSGVGEHLLRRMIAAYPAAKARMAGLRMIVVAGPRIDPATLPRADGVEVRAYVHDLYKHLAACDLAVVQGGLTTAMELTANRRPFIYFPLKHHFEQNFHVRHRLERYGAGRRMDFDTATEEDIAEAIAQEVGREVDYRPVESDGARRAAEKIAEML